ncbi:MAG: hypothetical protein WB609_06890 [Candidatus Cybelea sp.]
MARWPDSACGGRPHLHGGIVAFNVLLERLEPAISARASRTRETIYKLAILCTSVTQPAVGREG